MEQLTDKDLKVIFDSLMRMPLGEVLATYNKVITEMAKRQKEKNEQSKDKK